MNDRGGADSSQGEDHNDRSLKKRQLELLRIGEGSFNSQILFAGNELGIFDELASGPRTSRDLATAVGAQQDALERLLNGAILIGLLQRDGDSYSNTELADETLVTGRRGYLGNWIGLLGRRARVWSNLADVVRSGEPAVDQVHLGEDPNYTRDFMLGMHDYAQLRGREVVRHIDLSGGLRLLDLGGGPGTYSIHFAKRWPDLSAVVFDLPGSVPFATEKAAEAGVDDRVSVQAGDYRRDEIGDSEYDVVFISDVLHQESPDGCRALLTKTHAAIKPGGRVIVQGMFLDESRVGPRWPVIMSLTLLLIPGEGRSYTVAETIRFLEETGFSNCRHNPMSIMNVNSLVLGDRV